jgi:hypothetical protein
MVASAGFIVFALLASMFGNAKASVKQGAPRLADGNLATQSVQVIVPPRLSN